MGRRQVILEASAIGSKVCHDEVVVHIVYSRDAAGRFPVADSCDVWETVPTVEGFVQKKGIRGYRSRAGPETSSRKTHLHGQSFLGTS